MLTVHVGLAKTGSTAIQNYLANAPTRVRRQITYLGDDNLRADEGFRVHKHRRQGRSQALSIAHRNKDVVISSESFLGSAFSMYEDARSYAMAIHKYFAEQTQFQVVVYLRPQHQWFESLYAQFVQEGNSELPDEFVGRLRQYRYASYTSLVDDLKEVLGPDRLIVRAYDSGANVVEDFLRLVSESSLSEFSASSTARANVSVNPAQVELLRRINESTTDPLIRQQGRWFFQYIAVTDAPRKFSIFPKILQTELRNHTQTDWQTLSSAVQGTRLASPEVFLRAAEKITSEAVRPAISANSNHEEIIREASRSLEVAIPILWSRNRTMQTRARRLVSQIHMGGRTGFRGLLPYMTRHTSTKIHRIRQQRPRREQR